MRELMIREIVRRLRDADDGVIRFVLGFLRG